MLQEFNCSFLWLTQNSRQKWKGTNYKSEPANPSKVWSLYTSILFSSGWEKEIPLPLKRDRDDRLFRGILVEESAIRKWNNSWIKCRRESPILPPVNQTHTCHPERQRGISFSHSAIEFNWDVIKDWLQKEGKCIKLIF